MRLNLKKRDHLIEGQVKIVSCFLWFPKNINNELRWLEYVRYEKIVVKTTPNLPKGGCYSPGDAKLKWKDVRFL